MEQKSTEQKELQFEWSYQAPVDLIFDALTSSEHLKNWYSPAHLVNTFAESKVEVGGEYKIGVTQPDGNGPEMMFIGRYLKVDKPNQISYTQAFSMGKDYPPTPETTITIKLKQNGSKTVLKFTDTGFDSDQVYEGAKNNIPTIYEKFSKYIESLSK